MQHLADAPRRGLRDLDIAPPELAQDEGEQLRILRMRFRKVEQARGGPVGDSLAIGERRCLSHCAVP
jgi:hypothetical protein